MHCPRCRKEYAQGVTHCPDCDLDLAEDSPPRARDEAEWVDLVTVLETADPSLLMVAKSLLDVEDLPSFVEGVGIYEGLGAGRVAEADMPMGPGRLRVHPQDAEAARELLASLPPPDEPEAPRA
jgi:hypothetical protein